MSVSTVSTGVGTEAVTRSASTSPPTARGQNRAGWLFTAPFLVLYVLFLIGPVLIGVVISLFNTTTVQSGLGGWVGLSNYADVLSNPEFWSSMWHSVLFTLLTTPLLVLLPLLFAILASRMVRHQWFFRLAFFAPYVVPSSAVCLIFAFMYTPQTGLVSNAFGWVGLTAPDFFGTTSGAWLAVTLLTVWWTFGFNFILYTAAIQELSEEVYEAADIDGAGPWQQIRLITVPLLRPTMGLVLILQVLSSLKVFDQMYIMPQGGPNFATRSILQYVYDEGFTNFRVGYASAVSMLFFVVVLAVSAIWFWLVRKQEKET